jgi:hypothetical protein
VKRGLFVLFAVIGALGQASSSVDAQAPPSLTFFKHYFLTGDYVVEGVGLRGTGNGGVATGQIVVDSVPANVDIAAAFLYWQVVGSTTDPEAGALGVTFRGNALDSATLAGVSEPFGKLLGGGTPPCWSNGGGTGSSNGSNRTYSFRADVLRFLEVDPATGKLAANGSHAVALPDRRGLAALGASLVVVYRDPTLPLSGIVIYDGAYTLDQSTRGMSLTVGGFYDAGTAAKLTHIVGSGQANKGENLTYNGTRIAENPFASSAGPNWDNPTFALDADPSRQEITTGVDVTGLNSFDCLSWAAVVYRTTVKDGDGDGLLDRWETSTAPILDPNGVELPNLALMGAQPDRKDLFIELGYMKTDVPVSYGGFGQTDCKAEGNDCKDPHSHLPSHAALKLVGDMFANAPGGSIAVHFDVGSAYPAGEADPYIIRGEGLARGGEAIDESVTVCDPQPGDAPWVCQFSKYPGTVGWKTGFRLLRDEILFTPVGQDCDAPGNRCERRFDENRNNSFHYALFAHALGLPKSEFACLDATGAPVDDVNGQCSVAPNPDFRVPRTNTGIGDFPGGDLIVSLGAFSDAAGLPIGTPFMQASTLAHELGHNAERRHGGEAFEPNCKPTYLSAMNYLYQLRGLLDDAGKPHLDFAGSMTVAPVDEASLIDGDSSFLPYRLGWYAPLATSYLSGRVPAARTHCDGSPIAPGEPAMVRIDARTAASPFDWNADGVITTPAFAQDVNFNGRVNGTGGSTPALGSSDDWAGLRLDQVGVRRNVGGLYLVPGTSQFAVGPLSLSVGKGDLGKGDLGKGDLGKGDLGKGDLGKGDLGKGDLGKGDLGKGDLGKGDLGGGDLFLNDPNNPGGELDFETATDLARTPPNEFTACVAGVDGCGDLEAGLHDVVANWTTPNVGGVANFTLYRVDGPTLRPGQIWTAVAHVAAVPGTESYRALDTTELVDGAKYTYFSVATYADGVQSDASNLVTITAVNDPAVADDDAYATSEDTPLVVQATGVLANDTDPDSDVTLTAELVSGPSHGSLTFGTDGSFSYTPAANYFGPDAFTYRAVSGASTTNVATVSITVVSVNDAPAAFDIVDQAIDQDTSAGPLGFTIVDEAPATVTMTGSSSDTTLVPNTSIVFGGTGANRTVTVTPAAGQSGTAVITVTAIDADGAARQDTFQLTVRSTVTALYTFVGVKNLPPPDGAKFKAGSAIPMSWQYRRGSTVVDSAGLGYLIKFAGPLPLKTQVNTDTGSSNFRYQASSKTWLFNLQTKDLATGRGLAPGTYEVTITPKDPRYAPSPTFLVTLVK